MLRRALHFVFKIGDRKETIKFFTKILGMKVLRHEEFEEGCKATCNGPYDGKWSKTMIGYGPEDEHFVIELTYNYGVRSYKMGNDFGGITINTKDVISNSQVNNWPIKEENNIKYVEAPGGYKFFVDEEPLKKSDPVQKVTLSCSNIQNSLNYWKGILGMQIFEEKDNSVLLGYSTEQCKLELKQINEPVRHEQAFGRIAFSCPTTELAEMEKKIQNAGQKIITPLVSLDTPGKATVSVIILADPDDHEICFVGDEAFRELSQFDPNGEKLLKEAIEADKSDEWFAKRGISKKEI